MTKKHIFSVDDYNKLMVLFKEADEIIRSNLKNCDNTAESMVLEDALQAMSNIAVYVN